MNTGKLILILLAVFFIWPGCATVPSDSSSGGQLIRVKGEAGRGDTALSELALAASDGDMEKVKRLLEEGAEVNPRCHFNNICKPLAWAAERNDIEMMKLLIAYGADVNGTNAYLDAPLHYAIEKNNKEAMVVLFEAGANVNQPNAFGISPFIAICGTDDLELVGLFIKYGGNPNSGFSNVTSGSHPADGCNALMTAAMYGQKKVVELLLQNGANPDLKDAKGRTALDYARMEGHEDIVKLLSK